MTQLRYKRLNCFNCDGFFERMGMLTEQAGYLDSYGRSLGGLIKAVYTLRRMPKKLHSNNRNKRLLS